MQTERVNLSPNNKIMKRKNNRLTDEDKKGMVDIILTALKKKGIECAADKIMSTITDYIAKNTKVPGAEFLLKLATANGREVIAKTIANMIISENSVDVEASIGAKKGEKKPMGPEPITAYLLEKPENIEMMIVTKTDGKNNIETEKIPFDAQQALDSLKQNVTGYVQNILAYVNREVQLVDKNDPINKNGNRIGIGVSLITIDFKGHKYSAYKFADVSIEQDNKKMLNRDFIYIISGDKDTKGKLFILGKNQNGEIKLDEQFMRKKEYCLSEISNKLNFLSGYIKTALDKTKINDYQNKDKIDDLDAKYKQILEILNNIK